MKPLTIGKVALATGVKVTTIRYYESIGLLAEPGRSESGQRQYGEDAIERLKFIRHARELGFAVPSIRDLIDMQSNAEGRCDSADAVAQKTLAKIRSRLARLKALEAELERMTTQCSGTSVKTCNILQVLSDHSLCADEVHVRPIDLDDTKFSGL